MPLPPAERAALATISCDRTFVARVRILHFIRAEVTDIADPSVMIDSEAFANIQLECDPRVYFNGRRSRWRVMGRRGRGGASSALIATTSISPVST